MEVIKPYTMANLLCENSDLPSVQMQAFLADSKSNILVDCDKLNVIDMEAWREKK